MLNMQDYCSKWVSIIGLTVAGYATILGHGWEKDGVIMTG